MNKLFAVSALLFFGIVVAQPQDDGLTARDAFWSASDLVTVAQNPAAKTPPPTSPATRKPPKPVGVVKKTPQPTEVAVQIDPQIVTASGYGVQPHIVQVSAKSSQPLGLRYTLLQERSGGDYAEVFPETVFHTGDKVKLSVMANQPGYLYIIQQGSSGSWLPLFPAQNAASDSNRVEPGQVYLVPSASDETFQFNQQQGKERLFVLLSREPITDLDQVIFGLQHKTSSPATQANAAPSMEADNRINDKLVQQLQSRDLTLVKETSQETKDAEYGEKAIYVVSKGTGKNAPSSVSSDLVLDHE